MCWEIRYHLWHLSSESAIKSKYAEMPADMFMDSSMVRSRLYWSRDRQAISGQIERALGNNGCIVADPGQDLYRMPAFAKYFL